jgi:hemolysin D
LAKAEEQVGALTAELTKATQRSADTQLLAPVAGVVQQLAVHTIGGVVTSAEQLLVVVPEDGNLTVEALVANRDVGFIHTGQDVEIKVEAFTFTRYGLLSGTVEQLSHDTVPENHSNIDRPNEPDRTNVVSGPSSQAAYVARIRLNQKSIDIDGEERKLVPGMAVTAEIKTGSRSILSFLLSPLHKTLTEAARER